MARHPAALANVAPPAPRQAPSAKGEYEGDLIDGLAPADYYNANLETPAKRFRRTVEEKESGMGEHEAALARMKSPDWRKGVKGEGATATASAPTVAPSELDPNDL